MTGSVPDPSPQSDRKQLGDFARVLREAGPYLGLGSALAVTVGACFGFGFWLDGLLGTRPALALVFGSLGVVLALVQFVRTASRVKPKPRNSDSNIQTP